MTTHSSIALSIDPGIRNIAFCFVDIKTDEFISSSTFGCDGLINKSDWFTFIQSLKQKVKITKNLIPSDSCLTHIIIEKQKEHPFIEISGIILSYILEEYIDFIKGVVQIIWVDPRAVSKKMKLNPDNNRLAKKQNTILIACEHFKQPAYSLTDHEADCLINYLYCKEKSVF